MFIDAHIEAIPDAKRIKCTSSDLAGGDSNLAFSGRGQQCSDGMYSVLRQGSFTDQLFGDSFTSVFIGITILLVSAILVTVFVYRLKEPFQIWLHAKYGIRFRMKSRQA